MIRNELRSHLGRTNSYRASFTSIVPGLIAMPDEELVSVVSYLQIKKYRKFYHLCSKDEMENLN